MKRCQVGDLALICGMSEASIENNWKIVRVIGECNVWGDWRIESLSGPLKTPAGWEIIASADDINLLPIRPDTIEETEKEKELTL